MKSSFRYCSWTKLALVFAPFLFAEVSSAQTTPTSPAATLPNETPVHFQPATATFDYARRDVMIPMRDGVKLHTVILVPKAQKARRSSSHEHLTTPPN